jgi:hypothetical protein
LEGVAAAELKTAGRSAGKQGNLFPETDGQAADGSGLAFETDYGAATDTESFAKKMQCLGQQRRLDPGIGID